MIPYHAATIALGCFVLSAATASAVAAIPTQLVAVQYTTVSAELPGKIDRIAVKEGERFKVGQELVAFDCVLQQAQLDEAQATFGAAEKSKEVHARLLELNSAGTLETEKAASDAAVALAKLNSARAVTSKCMIAAPFSGRVVEQKARAHQYIQAGQAILDILDDSTLEAEFIMSSDGVRSIKLGMPIQITVDEVRKKYPARIIRIGAKIDAVSHTIKIVAEVRGDHPELIAGMTGHVQLATPAAASKRPAHGGIPLD